MLKRPLKMFRFARKLEAEKEMLLSWTDSLIQDLDKLCAALARNGLSAQTEIENQKKAIDLLMSQKKVLEDTIEELKKKQNELRAENVRLKDLFEKIRDRMTTTAGVDAIRMERIRQIEKEGWTEEYDDQLRGEELSNAAVCYAFPPKIGSYISDYRIQFWPFHSSWWKPSPENRKRELEKAGALIAAEWDRLDRIEKLFSSPPPDPQGERSGGSQA